MAISDGFVVICWMVVVYLLLLLFLKPREVQLSGFEENDMNRAIIVAAVGIAAAAPQYADDVRHLTLTEAVHLAISQNRALKIARLKVAENEQKKAGERSSYFPSLKNESNILHVTDLQNISIPAGAFGTVGGSYVPSQNTILPQGQTTFYTSGTQLSQPLTQLIRIHDANRIAAADVAISRDDLKKAENEVALEVHSVYYGILIAKLQKQAAEQQTQYADENLPRKRGRGAQRQRAESRRDPRPGNGSREPAIRPHGGSPVVRPDHPVERSAGASTRHEARTETLRCRRILISVHARSTSKPRGLRIRRSRLPRMP